MTDIISKKLRSRNMSMIKNKNTKPEIKVRKYLFARGFRYRIHSNLLGKPDIVLSSKKIVIFVHGCFWHNHNCSKGTIPESNKQFWKKKFKFNKERDEKVSEELKKKGWTVLTVWQCEIDNQKKFNKRMLKLIYQLNI